MKVLLANRFFRIVFIIIFALGAAYLLTLFLTFFTTGENLLNGFSKAFAKTNNAFFLLLSSPLVRVYSGEIRFNMMSFSQWLNETTPLILTGLAIALVFNAGILNLGAEGQLFAGAVAGSCLAVIPNIPGLLHLVIIFLAAAVMGALWSVLPAYASIKKKNSEILVSLMMNYLALYLGIYMIKRTIRDETSGALMSVKFDSTAALPFLNERYKLHIGIIFAILIAIIFWYIIKRTPWGLKIRLIGSNMRFARYSGIKVKTNLFKLQLVSGAIAGTAGIVELIGYHGRFLWTTTPGYGWDGIIVAIMASKNPLYIPLSAAFLAYIRIGAQNMGRYTEVSPDLVKVIQAIIIIFLTAELLFSSGKCKPFLQKLRVKADG